MKKILIIIFLLISSVSFAQLVDWQMLTGSATAYPRDHGAAVTFNAQVWMFAGDGIHSDAERDVWSSYNGQNWSAVTLNADFGMRFYHTALSYHGNMWVIAGSNDINYGSGSRADAWYSDNGVDWTPATQNAAFGPRSYLLSTVFLDKMWVVGGRAGGTPFKDAWYSTNGADWIAATRNAEFHYPALITSSQIFVYNNLMWIINGATEVWNTSDGIVWTQVPIINGWGGTRPGFSAIVYNNLMWIIGGNVSSNDTNDVYYSSDGANWTLDSTGQFTPREDFQLLTENGFLLLMNGSNNGTLLNDVWLGTLETSLSSPTPTYTATPLETWTNIYTSTFTPTFTITQSMTYTMTPTITPASPTFTQTNTAYNTVTLTWTVTPTFTATQTITQTWTVTPTFTVSATYTITPTSTTYPTPFLQHLANDTDDYADSVLLQWQLYPNAQYVIQYGATLQFHVFLNNYFNISESPDMFIYELKNLKISGAYPVQLQVQTTSPAMTLNSNVITVSPIASPTP